MASIVKVSFISVHHLMTYLDQKRIHPFCEGLLLDVQTLLLQRLDALVLELDNAIALRHVDRGAPGG